MVRKKSITLYIYIFFFHLFKRLNCERKVDVVDKNLVFI